MGRAKLKNWLLLIRSTCCPTIEFFLTDLSSRVLLSFCNLHSPSSSAKNVRATTLEELASAHVFDPHNHAPRKNVTLIIVDSLCFIDSVSLNLSFLSFIDGFFLLTQRCKIVVALRAITQATGIKHNSDLV